MREHFRDVEAELARLEAQAAFLWPKEEEVLARHGFPLDGRVLEVGCGPGFVTDRLIGLRDGSIVAIDNDPEMIALAQTRFEGRDADVEFLEASVLELPFADATFDAATARLVFQHLPDPQGALAEIHRVLRPGARLFVTDVDDGWGLLLEPEPPYLEEVTAAVAGMRSHRGGDPRIGRGSRACSRRRDSPSSDSTSSRCTPRSTAATASPRSSGASHCSSRPSRRA